MDRRVKARSAPGERRPSCAVAVRRTHSDTSTSVSPTTGEGWKLTHLQWLRGRYRRNAVLHCVLHFREGAHLDLAHALARDAEFLGQLRERDSMPKDRPTFRGPNSMQRRFPSSNETVRFVARRILVAEGLGSQD